MCSQSYRTYGTIPRMSGRLLPESLGYFLLTALLCVPALAADGAPKTLSPLPGSKLHSQQEVFAAERLAYWQRRLNLEDWHITVSVCRASELRPETLGNIRWDSERKTAAIRVMDVADYTLAFPAVLRDVEATVVHELVHLELVYLPRTESSASPEERAVARITEALLFQHHD